MLFEILDAAIPTLLLSNVSSLSQSVAAGFGHLELKDSCLKLGMNKFGTQKTAPQVVEGHGTLATCKERSVLSGHRSPEVGGSCGKTGA